MHTDPCKQPLSSRVVLVWVPNKSVSPRGKWMGFSFAGGTRVGSSGVNDNVVAALWIFINMSFLLKVDFANPTNPTSDGGTQGASSLPCEVPAVVLTSESRDVCEMALSALVLSIWRKIFSITMEHLNPSIEKKLGLITRT